MANEGGEKMIIVLLIHSELIKTLGQISSLFSSIIRAAFEMAFVIYLNACVLLLKLYIVESLLVQDLRFSSLSSQ